MYSKKSALFINILFIIYKNTFLDRYKQTNPKILDTITLKLIVGRQLIINFRIAHLLCRFERLCRYFFVVCIVFTVCLNKLQPLLRYTYTWNVVLILRNSERRKRKYFHIISERIPCWVNARNRPKILVYRVYFQRQNLYLLITFFLIYMRMVARI